METTETPPLRPAWRLDDLRDLVEPPTPDRPSQVRGPDWKGLVPPEFAAALAAVNSDKLLPLLALLEPGDGSQLKDIVDLLEKIAASQVEIQALMRAIALRIGVQPAPSTASTPTESASSPPSLADVELVEVDAPML